MSIVKVSTKDKVAENYDVKISAGSTTIELTRK